MLHLALSFAHVHKHNLASASFARADVVGLVQARHVVERLPARLADDEENCPICFSGFLLSNAWLPAAPANPHSLQFLQIDPAFDPVSGSVFQPRRAAFLSRAPPAA